MHKSNIYSGIPVKNVISELNHCFSPFVQRRALSVDVRTGADTLGVVAPDLTMTVLEPRDAVPGDGVGALKSQL